jgi:RNA polymerase sigma factor (sigma-70 family)
MDEPLETVRRDMVALLPRLRRFARSLTANASDADDLVQDAVERALRNLHKWQPGTRLDSWMFRLTHNLWIDTVRARRVRPTVPFETEGVERASTDGARELDARLAYAETCSAMDKLPEDQRVAVALVFIDGMSYRDAADLLQVPIGTVTSRLARARTALAALLVGVGAKPSEVLS